MRIFKGIGLTIILATLLMSAALHKGSIYSSKTGNVSFFSHTDIEDIQAENHKAQAAFDAHSGKMQFSLLIKDFEFKKALMQEHFNENYMESDKYPRAKFNGTIDSVSRIKFTTDGTYTSKVSGKLTIKDQTRSVSADGTFKVKGDVVNGTTRFIVNPEDFNIKIPSLVKRKISDAIEVTVDVDFKQKQ